MSDGFITEVVRGEREPFNPVKISPSRVDKYLTCGEQFRRSYIDREPSEQSGGPALFGQVMHAGLEPWSLDRSQSLVTLVHQAWPKIVEDAPVVRKFIAEYQKINISVMKAEAEAIKKWEADPRNKGKTSKAPRMTKHFKESAPAKELNRLLAIWIPRLNAESPWKFTERDPLPFLYDESLKLAKKYSVANRELPPSLHTEFGFNVPWKQWILNGFIDSIDPVLLPTGELRGYAITDYKTYRNEPAGAKDWRQGCIYDLSFDFLCRNGQLPFDPDLPRWIVFDYMRLGTKVDYIYGPADYDVLERDLTMYTKGVSHGVFLPASKGQNPDYCDYEDCCLKSRGPETGKRGDLFPQED